MDINNKYDRRGVSFDKKDVHDAIRNIDKGLFPNSFCKIIPDIIDNDDEMCLIMHADGAGTKSSQLMHIGKRQMICLFGKEFLKIH